MLTQCRVPPLCYPPPPAPRPPARPLGSASRRYFLWVEDPVPPQIPVRLVDETSVHNAQECVAALQRDEYGPARAMLYNRKGGRPSNPARAASGGAPGLTACVVGLYPAKPIAVLSLAIIIYMLPSLRMRSLELR